MQLGVKIKELRARKGFTQENMADLLQMSATNYAYIEQGKVKVNVDKLKEIAQVLDTDIFELLALGESNVIYINSTNKDETSNNQSA